MSVLDFDNSVAVVIGIDRYGHGISPLRTAVADASAIAQVLAQKHNYTVITLLDERAQLTSLRTLIQESLPQQLSASSRLLLYFAGHGIAHNGDNGPEGYLIPQDAKSHDLRSYLPMIELHDALTKLPCRHFLAVFDCCFAGAFRWSSTRAATYVPEVMHKERFDRFRKEPAWQVITSAAYNQTAMDVLALKDNREAGPQGAEVGCALHSPFAAALLDALGGAADTSPPAKDGRPAGDGVLTATELYLYLRDTVEPLTEENAQRQTPEICALRKHRQGEFIFLTPGHTLNLPPAPELDKKNNPYLGLNAFDIEDADLYYGRQTLTKDLIEFVETHALTVVLGPSGTGKSSLVKAGLLPALQQNRSQTDPSQTDPSQTDPSQTDPSQTWHVLPVMRPGESPLKALAQALLSLQAGTTKIRQIESLSAKLYNSPKAIVDSVLAWKKANPDKQLLLVIDQFEEVITLCQQEKVKQQFLELLKLAVSTGERLGSIVITLRSDFEPQFLDTVLQPYWMASRFMVRPMGRGDLRQVIEQPALKRVLYFEPPSLVGQLLDEVVQTPGGLPLLSFTLSELYLRYLERRSDNRALTKEDYETLGGVAGSLTQRATQEYERLVKRDARYEQTVRNIMLRMVSLEGGELARRRVPEAELVYATKEENQRVQTALDAFVDARLLVRGQTSIGEAYVEPAHDALVRGWAQLLRWQRKAQEEMLLKQPLDLAVVAWKCEQGALWNKDRRLGLLQEIMGSEKTWLNRDEGEFVTQSIRLKRRNKWQRRIFVALMVVGSLAVSGVMIWLSNRAETQRQLAVTNERLAKENEQIAKIGKEEATLKEKSARASRWASSGQAVEGLMLSLSTLRQSVDNADTYNLGVQDDARKSIRDTVRLAREGNILRGHEQGVLAIALDPSDRYIVSTGKDRTLKLWDAKSGELLSERVEAHQSSIYDVAISPDGKYLASAGNDGNQAALRIWEISEIDGKLQLSAEPKHKLTAHDGSVYGVDFHPKDSRRLVSAGQDQTLRLWDVETGRQVTPPIVGHFSSVRDAEFSPDGGSIVSGSVDNTIRVWDAATGRQRRLYRMAHRDAVFSVAFNAVGDRIVSASADRSVRVWNAATGESVADPLRGHDGKVYSAIFSADGNTIMSTGSDRTIRFWDVATATAISTIPEAHSSLIWDLALSRDGKQLISSSADAAVRLWDIANDLPLGQPRRSPHNKDILSVAVSPDGQYVVSSGEDRRLSVWNAKTQALVWNNPDAHRAPIQSVAFSPTESKFISASNDGTLRFWETTTGKRLGETSPIADGESSVYEMYSVAFHPEGEIVASGGRDGKIHIWNVASRQQEIEWLAHEKRILAIAYSPDGRYIASASGDDTVNIWEADTRVLKHRLAHDQDVWTIAFSPDGEHIASGSTDSNVRLWHIETGSEVDTLRGHTNDVASVAFRPDGKQLASASFDRTIRLWNTASLNTDSISTDSINTATADGPPLIGHTQNVWAVQFMPDGKSLVSGSADLSLRWWPSDWSAWPSMACDRLQNHPLFVSPETVTLENSDIAEIAEEGKAACNDSFWQD